MDARTSPAISKPARLTCGIRSCCRNCAESGKRGRRHLGCESAAKRDPPQVLAASLKRYGTKALEESAARAEELAAQDDHNGAAVWRRITDAVGQLANKTPPGPVHWRQCNLWR